MIYVHRKAMTNGIFVGLFFNITHIWMRKTSYKKKMKIKTCEAANV